MTEQSLMSRLGAKFAPFFSKRVFPHEWVEAGQDRTRLEVIANKRRAFDGPRPDAVLRRSWGRASTQVAGHPLHLLTPTSGSTGTVLFYCHGGAFVVGPSAFEWLHAAKFAAAIGCDLALYDYPKVPEHDSEVIRGATRTAYDLIAQRYPTDRIAIAGLSAGGGLAASTMLQLHRDGRELPICATLFSPWLDMTVSHPDAPDYTETDVLLPLRELRHDGLLYSGSRGMADPLVSPRFAAPDELAALPPTCVTVGEKEILRPEGAEFVDKLRSAGVDASLHIERFGQHAGVMAGSAEGNEVFTQAVTAMRRWLKG